MTGDSINNKWKHGLKVASLRHVIIAGIDNSGKTVYKVPSGQDKTMDQLTNEELMDLQTYQPSSEDSGRI